MGILDDVDRVSRTIDNVDRRVNQVEGVANRTSSVSQSATQNWKILIIGAAIILVGIIVYYLFFNKAWLA